MRRVRSKDTKPELAVRRLVHSLGYRYRLHCSDLPGKAVPSGGRRGVLTPKIGRKLYDRLNERADSIERAGNLESSDFSCRCLVVDDIWIPLGESLLIQRFSPIWNSCLDGFDNHDPGGGRRRQQRSPWDIIHPGRPWAELQAENKRSYDEILETVHEAVKAIFDS